MIEASLRHKKNVERLEMTLNFLKESEHDNLTTEKSSCCDLEFIKFIKKWKNSRHEPVDYEMVSVKTC